MPNEVKKVTAKTLKFLCDCGKESTFQLSSLVEDAVGMSTICPECEHQKMWPKSMNQVLYQAFLAVKEA